MSVGEKVMQGLSYLELWKRVGASIIDFIILFVLTPMFMAFFCVFAKTPPPALNIINATGAIILGTIFLVISWLYFGLTESSKKQGSIGKRVLRLVVTDLQGNKISFYKASLRFWGKFIIFPGFSLTGCIAKKRALHDIMAGTLVVNKLVLSSANLGNKTIMAV
jgi:uncharacterized RDD family membrane protein YckC